MARRKGNKAKPLRPSWLRGRLAKWAMLPYRMALGALLAKRVLILTTTGRVTGKERRTPLWYIRAGDIIYCVSGWGSSSDWLKNLNASPNVLVQVGKESWGTQGVLIKEPSELERVLSKFQRKYGRHTVRLIYHMDRLCLVAFPLDINGKRREECQTRR